MMAIVNLMHQPETSSPWINAPCHPYIPGTYQNAIPNLKPVRWEPVSSCQPDSDVERRAGGPGPGTAENSDKRPLRLAGTADSECTRRPRGGPRSLAGSGCRPLLMVLRAFDNRGPGFKFFEFKPRARSQAPGLLRVLVTVPGACSHCQRAAAAYSG